jgi:hypothetical protein
VRLRPEKALDLVSFHMLTVHWMSRSGDIQGSPLELGRSGLVHGETEIKRSVGRGSSALPPSFRNGVEALRDMVSAGEARGGHRDCQK